MHILLTHEQADFDAIASLLGAYLLDDLLIPVLPRRMNRNVRAFIMLYGADLPFVDPRDLPVQPIEAVTLVDTQSVVSIKGMRPETRFYVIDHHPIREGLPGNWTVTYQEAGATVTILSDALRDRDAQMTPIQATLLLLGIYEDTGSLTYAHTTSRDLQAAAFLLDHGASLNIATNFLNHPLSHAQQTLYDALRANIEHFHIHGHTIIVACGDALDLDEELSSIVHKLRDLLDPDAIFVLVSTRSGIQLIARSTTDQIDVAMITSAFGGGGHDRAAAALIRAHNLESIRAKLIKILPDAIQPAITVASIMSYGLQVLTPDTPVEEAAQRMRRYGYEGYPVVQSETLSSPGENGNRNVISGKVVGLLTRRSVDRALAHKLRMTAASLMEAGEVTIPSDASIENLQRLMTDTGWGQIPVIAPQTDEIIGIVTRTDLLKILNPQTKFAGHQNLASRLENRLTSERLKLLKMIAQTAHTNHIALYIVGGFVRDLILDQPSQDFDLVVEGDAIRLAHALADHYGGKVTSHTRFGTAKWHLEQSIDLVSARTEFYTYPSALPTVEPGSIKLDLHRRDFTINTLALRLDGSHYGELHDYWGGLDDLHHGWVRVLHSLSFVDDPTRILRVVRFEQRFNFQIEKRTMELLQEAISLLDRVPGDRIRHELNAAFIEKTAPEILARLDELGLLKAIHPNLQWDAWLQAVFKRLAESEPDDYWSPIKSKKSNLKIDLAYILWLLRLSPDQFQRTGSRLRLSAYLTQIIDSAAQLWQDLPDLLNKKPSYIVRRMEKVPTMARFAIFLATDDSKIHRLLQDYEELWQNIHTSINGDDLRGYTVPPGPIYRHILNKLREARLDGVVTNADQELRLLEQLIQEKT